MSALTFEEARACVLREVRAAGASTETVALLEAAERVLAERVVADRDYPPVARSVRDGFAVRAQDLPGELAIAGEVRAGESFAGELRAGQAIEIMTGAPVPRGADAVVMVEHCRVNDGRVKTDRAPKPGENISPQGCEARAGDIVLEPGRRLDFAAIAALATVGRTEIAVYRRTRVAIIATGDEVVEVSETPREFQVRNSNAQSLAAQCRRAGACPEILPVARDVYDSTRELVERGLQYDLLLLSGGVSAGKYDIVERVLADCGAEFYFDRVKIQPGQPLVFGGARGTFFFGLPGNPASTMVTFELFARTAIERLGGVADPWLPLTWSTLSGDVRVKPGLTRFLPARISVDGAEIAPVAWRGSSDVFALARANAFLVTDPERDTYQAGELIRVLLK